MQIKLDKYSYSELIYINTKEINSYVGLISELRKFNIKPQEAYYLCIGKKFEITDRSLWTRLKVRMYLKYRFIEAMTELNKIKDWKKKEAVQKLTYLVKQRNYNLCNKKKKTCENVVLRDDYQHLLSITYDKKIYEKGELTKLIKNKELRKIEMKSETNYLRKLIKEADKKPQNLKNFLRKEAENLHKIVTESRHNEKFFKSNHQKWLKQLKKDGFIIDNEQSFINFIR